MTEICDRVAEAQALLHDHIESGRFTSDEIVKKLAVFISEEGLLRAMSRKIADFRARRNKK
jgi:hypothetical protein